MSGNPYLLLYFAVQFGRSISGFCTVILLKCGRQGLILEFSSASNQQLNGPCDGIDIGTGLKTATDSYICLVLVLNARVMDEGRVLSSIQGKGIGDSHLCGLDYGGLARAIAAQNYGKRLRKGCDGFGNGWIRADGADGKRLKCGHSSVERVEGMEEERVQVENNSLPVVL